MEATVRSPSLPPETQIDLSDYRIVTHTNEKEAQFRFLQPEIESILDSLLEEMSVMLKFPL